MHHITVTFSPLNGRIDGQKITARGIHGLLFHLLRQHDVNETTWLHSHPSPKPFSLVPLYTEDGSLAGLRLAAILERAAHLFLEGWHKAWQNGQPLRLGWQELRVREVVPVAGPGFADLAAKQSDTQVHLRFLSPTAFKQGPGSLPLPLPANVFSWPFRVWKSFAPAPLSLPEEWLAWCEQDVFVVEHQIETATVSISKQESFTGFVGDVRFRAETRHPDSKVYLHVWQALASLAAFCGVGHKTTMGMGAVDRLEHGE